MKLGTESGVGAWLVAVCAFHLGIVSGLTVLVGERRRRGERNCCAQQHEAERLKADVARAGGAGSEGGSACTEQARWKGSDHRSTSLEFATSAKLVSERRSPV